MGSLNDTPAGYPEDADGQMDWLFNTAQRVVDFCWMPPSNEDIKVAARVAATTAATKEIYPFCICEESMLSSSYFPIVPFSNQPCWVVIAR